MGVDLGDLVEAKEISLENLRAKKVAIDAYNIIYQFLSIIRQRDGAPLKDSKGRPTSHLSGLFYRTCNFLKAGLKPVFVFDGQAPKLKEETREKRKEIKKEAKEKREKALEEGDLKEARKWAQQTSRLTKEMVTESKKLISAMGLPWVQAVGEGEAQAAWMAKQGSVYGVISQDFDALLFGAPILVRNLSISGKRKLPGKQAYKTIKPEKIELAEVLNSLKIDKKGLIKIALLLGTDYNKGVKGVGPKTALKIVREGNFEKYADKLSNLKKVKRIFLDPPITKDFRLVWQDPNEDKIRKILCDSHDFSEKRVNGALEKLSKAKGARDQEDLGEFF